MEMEFPRSKFEKTLKNEGENVYDIVNAIEVVSNEEKRDWPIEELKGAMEHSFREAGNKALEQNNGVICVTLSGGVDSSLGLAILRNKFPEAKIVAFTMGGSEDHEDIVYARMAVKKFNADHEVIIPSENDIAETALEYQKEFPENDMKQVVEQGDLDVYLLYKYISKSHMKLLLAYDGIDELMGGYWGHRKGETDEERKKAFEEFWERLIPYHLKPLLATSKKFGVQLVFPYLEKNLATLISKIPVSNRISDEVGKLPIRELARMFDVPEEIITRSKRGQVGMMEIEGRRNK